jgi:HD domain.
MNSFATDDEHVQRLIDIKKEHSQYVAGYMRNLAQALKLGANDLNLAEAIGLCHDVGRFKQAVIYRSFKDSATVDHGRLGAAELQQAAVEPLVGAADWGLFLHAVKWHNAMSVARHPDPRTDMFTRMIRDTDKLDIYRVLPPADYSDGCSPGLLAQALAGQLLRYADVKTADDKKLIMLTWVYDVKYAWTLREMLAAGYLDRLMAALPHNREVELFCRRLREYSARKLSE